MCKKWLLGFKDFPRKERSIDAIRKSYALTNIVRGNVFCRIGGVISVEDHKTLVKEAKNITLENIN